MKSKQTTQDQLIQIFMRTLSLSEEQAKTATIENTDNWDSFTHMNLILSIEVDLLRSEIDPNDAVELISFRKIYEYVYTRKCI